MWLDPVRVAQAVENLADALVRDAGLDADRVAACTDAYLADLADLHRDIAEHTGRRCRRRQSASS